MEYSDKNWCSAFYPREVELVCLSIYIAYLVRVVVMIIIIIMVIDFGWWIMSDLCGILFPYLLTNLLHSCADKTHSFHWGTIWIAGNLRVSEIECVRLLKPHRGVISGKQLIWLRGLFGDKADNYSLQGDVALMYAPGMCSRRRRCLNLSDNDHLNIELNDINCWLINKREREKKGNTMSHIP